MGARCTRVSGSQLTGAGARAGPARRVSLATSATQGGEPLSDRRSAACQQSRGHRSPGSECARAQCRERHTHVEAELANKPIVRSSKATTALMTSCSSGTRNRAHREHHHVLATHCAVSAGSTSTTGEEPIEPHRIWVGVQRYTVVDCALGLRWRWRFAQSPVRRGCCSGC
jgi:hypothetical protein